ncbi:unnamed protein product [Hydatigera taeniaeformis]|uniref:E3 ubiquitin-protein ligase RNF10 n=1 Tax=Hydatigena taeniaeformis TaxID=6205 RepID=A0A0R3X848_HYDTA|nr:unnamed protein product [Hydatigera taeniaeformis]
MTYLRVFYSSAVGEIELEDVGWSEVGEVAIHSPTLSLCGRCYQRPFLPRIGPCGHIYCLVCIWVRIAFNHDERVETCPTCGRSLKVTDLKRVSIFKSYIPKVGDVMKFRLLPKDTKCVNSYVLDIWTAKYCAHLVKTKRRSYRYFIRKDIALMKKYMSKWKDAKNSTITRMVAGEIFASLLQEQERLNYGAESIGPFTKRYILHLHSYTVFLHAFNRACLSLAFKKIGLPKMVSGKVIFIECHTMDLNIREMIPDLRHVPLGHTFYLVLLEFEASTFSDFHDLQPIFGGMLLDFVRPSFNLKVAVGSIINSFVSLNMRHTCVYFVDELFSITPAEHRSFYKDHDGDIKNLEESNNWRSITLPSGSKAFFADSLLRRYLQEGLSDSL